MNIATDFNGFVDKTSEAIRTALNSEVGQQLTKELLKMKLKQNPNMTVEEWKQVKSEFMTFIFLMFVKETPEAVKEMGEHIYNELNGGNTK